MKIGKSRLVHLGVLFVTSAGLLGLAAAPASAASTDLSSANLSSASAGAVAHAAAPSAAANARTAAAVAFPSASSTVIGSIGFIDDDEVGYFWSASRGDSVTQVVSGPARVRRAILDVEVVTNGLVAGAHADWELTVNGKVAGSFVVNSGFTGPIHVSGKFTRQRGGEYDVAIRMTNEVAGGEGAHTLAYAGGWAHSVQLKKR
jgi:hypothetical protein